MEKQKKKQKGITLIALVISIIVMLILAGVSLNMTVGDNGIIKQAQNATIQSGMAVLQEYLQEEYVKNYDKFDNDESKVVQLQNIYPQYFYIPANEGIGALRYIVNSEGKALYLIKKSGLPNEIKDSLVGGDAGDGTYADYSNLNDVYGVTSDLKVYYCANGKDSISGLDYATLDSDNPSRKVLDSSSSVYDSLKIFDTDNDGIISSSEISSVTNLDVDSSKLDIVESLYKFPSLTTLKLKNLNVNNLNGIQNCSKLNTLYIESSVIENYTIIGELKNTLEKLYFYDINDDELTKICSKTVGIGSVDFIKLTHFGVVGYKAVLDWSIGSNSYFDSYGSRSASKYITTTTPLANLTENTKKNIVYMYLNNNKITTLSGISDYVGIVSLRVEGNELKNLSGLENINVTYLCAAANKLGELETYDATKEISTQYKDTDALKALENNTKIAYLRISENPEIKYTKYVANRTTINRFYGSGMTKLAEANNLIKVKSQSMPTFYLDQKYELDLLDKDETVSLNLANYSLTLSNLEAISKCTKIYRLSLENTKYVDNEGNDIAATTVNTKLNDCLKCLTKMQYLNLTGISALTSIDDFAEKETGLYQIILDGTSVSDVSKLDKCTSMKNVSLTYGTSSSTLTANTIKRCVNTDSWDLWGNRNAWRSSRGITLNSTTCFNAITWPTDITKFTCFGNYSSGGDVIDLSSCTELTYINSYSGNILKVPAGKINYVMTSGNKVEFVGTGNTVSIYVDEGQTDYYGQTFSCFNKIRFVDLSGDVSWLGSAPESFKKAVYSIAFGGASYARNLNFNHLKDYTNLEYLSFSNRTDYLGNATFADISNLSKLTEIRLFYIKNLNLNYLPLTNVQKLTAQYCNISSIYPLQSCTSMSLLDLTGNPLYDVSYGPENASKPTVEILKTLRTDKLLRNLYIPGHNITDTSQLSALTWTEKSGF